MTIELRNRLQFLLRDPTLNGGTAAISKTLTLITFPLLARDFRAEEYRALGYFLVFGNLLAFFYFLPGFSATLASLNKVEKLIADASYSRDCNLDCCYAAYIEPDITPRW